MRFRNLFMGGVLAGTILALSIGGKTIIASNSYYDESYYTQAIPTGYYDGVDLNASADEFKLDLYEIISEGYVKHSYSYNNTVLKYTDPDPNVDGNIICLYTGQSYASGVWNKEHVWAKSHGFPESGYSSSEPYSDAHHLRPTLISINSTRSSLDFGEVGSSYSSDDYGNKWSSSCFEPRDEVKGDVARMMFYMTVRYGAATQFNLQLVNDSVTSGSSLNGKFGNLQTLLKWHYEDPVSKEEIYRNNVIYDMFQKNRNPFIDHPEYVDIAYPSSYSSDVTVDNEAVGNVISMIEALPSKITLEDKQSVEECRIAYDLLNYAEKALVTNVATLTNAETTIKSLEQSSGTGDTGSSGNAERAELISGDFTTITGLSSSYASNITGTLDGRSYFFTNAYKSGSDVRLGSNSSTTLPSKYNCTGNSSADGTALEFLYDVENVSSITFTNAGNYGTISSWYILFSDNSFSSYSVVGSGSGYSETMTGTLSSPSTGRFAIVVVGTKPRLKLSSFAIYAELESSITFEETELDSGVIINYNETVNSCGLHFGFTFDAKLFDESASYGMLIVDNQALEGLTISELNDGSLEELLANLDTLEITYIYVDSTSVMVSKGDYYYYGVNIDNIDGHYDFEFTAVAYMEYNGELLLSAQKDANFKESLSLLLSTDILSEEQQLIFEEFYNQI